MKESQAVNPIIREVFANKHCERCVLSSHKKLITVRNRALKINQNYVPSSITTLLVAESPPTLFYKQPNRYFYAPGPIDYGTLFYNTMAALFAEEMKKYNIYDKGHFLNKFKENGYYLIDMAKCPIDKLSEKDKAKAISSCSKYLKKELEALQFQKVIFIGKGSFKKAEKFLNFGSRPQVVSLPFGSQRNVEDFRRELRRSL